MAAPITSAISVAIIANSVMIHKMKASFLSVRKRMAWAKSSWVTIPSLAAIY